MKIRGRKKIELHVKRGDLVEVVTGKDKGKRGKIKKVFPDQMRVVVEKVNMVKRHQRPTDKNPQGGIIEKEAPIHVSNVMIVCENCGRPVRTRGKVLADGSKVRVCIRCGEILDRR